jgi:hypothetical protein
MMGLLPDAAVKWESEHPAWPGTGTVRRYCGSWRAALTAAGLPSHPPLTIPIRERVLTAQNLFAEGLTAAEIAEILGITPDTARRYRTCGTCPRCGGPKVKPHSAMCVDCRNSDVPSQAELQAWVIERMQTWTHQTGQPPRASDWCCSMDGTESRWEREYSMWPAVPTVQRAFGSWNAGIAAAGLEMHRQDWDPAKVLEALREFIEQAGRTPTRKELLTVAGLPKYGTVIRYFGDWEHALTLAGGVVGRRRAWEREEVIDALRRFASRHGRPPTRGDLTGIHGSGYPAGSVVERTFGTFTAGLLAAGLDLRGRPRAATTADMLRALRSHHEGHGEWPNSQQWRDIGGWPSTSAIIRRFGGRSEAIASAAAEGRQDLRNAA